MCLRFLREAGTLDEVQAAQLLPGWRQPDALQQWALQVSEPVVARSDRFRFTETFQGLAVIGQAGTVIAFHDMDHDPVRTPFDDCVLVMPSVRQVAAGVTVVRYARRRVLTPGS